jgi:trans-aconitate methyltransferase
MYVTPDPMTATMQPDVFPCHVCGNERVEALSGFNDLGLVTSDCRPWMSGAKLGACEICGVVQKAVDKAWKADAESIYNGYQLYPQGGGAEQAVFDSLTGDAVSRSCKLLEKAVEHTHFQATGRILDIGCGNGALLRAFFNGHPSWTMVGNDTHEHYKAEIEAISGVEAFHQGDVRKLPGGFDLITMVHVLEHITEPVDFLKRLAPKLNPGGQLLIQVPCFLNNPFDLTIADHCSHFTLASLSGLLAHAGHRIVKSGENWVPRELTVIATPDLTASDDSKTSTAPLQEMENAASWMKALSLLARKAAAEGPVAVFGTSIAATWLAGEINQEISFFIDEDKARIGRTHLDRPVLAPSEAPRDVPVVLALSPALSATVSDRLRHLGLKWIVPPEFPGAAN